MVRQLEAPHEDNLIAAADLGRELLAFSVPPESLADLFAEALSRLARERPGLALDGAGTAMGGVFAEVLMAYGLAFRNRLETETVASAALRESEHRYRQVVETAPALIMVVSGEGVIEFVNRGAAGYTAAEMVGLHADEFVQEEAAKPFWQAMAEARATGEMQEYEIELVGADGQLLSYENKLSPFGTDDERFLIFSIDITERRRAMLALKEAEERLEQSQHQLHQAQKMEAIGRLAGGVAHDFNNLLTSIISFTRFVHDDLPVGDIRREDLSEVLRASDSATRLTSQLLSFSRRRPVAPVAVELNDALRNAHKMLRRIVGEPIELVLLLASDPIRVVFDPGQLEQVIFNLAANARDAMPEGGTLSIKLDTVSVREGASLAAGPHARLIVSDTGVGIPGHVLELLFEPFFTTKGEAGTGLGLATCYGLVTQAGGEIAVENAPDGGARFQVLLPLTDRLPESVAAPKVLGPELDGSGWRALVVEDQPAILKTMRRCLEGAGFDVTTGRTAEEGLRLAKDMDALHVLVSDVILPALTGPELAKRLREDRPELRVLLTSGYLGEGPTELMTDERTGFLPKPFSASDLLAAVGRLFVPA